MALTRTASGLCLANLHASTNAPRLATEDVLLAAREATAFAGDSPLLFGGDLNLRPAQDGWVFEELASRHGLRAPTDPDAIDHLLVRGMAIVSPAARWPAERRELDEGGLRLRLSDHSGVEAVFDTGSAQG
jgi:endonuclease/exonuclease/phosphatase family metal-dependent hydrolase